MLQGASQAIKDDEVERLQTEVAKLKGQSSIVDLAVNSILPLRLPGSLKQPRRYFDSEKLEKLKKSIAKHGRVLEPIVVRPGDDNYEILSGERRWRCCLDLGIEFIPATVLEADDSEALEIALIAHLLSESISQIEETDSIMGLFILRLQMPFDEIKRFLYAIKNFEVKGVENSEILQANKDKVGIVQAILEEFDLKLGGFVSNRLPLLEMPVVILEAVREGQLSPTNARIIAQQPEDFHEQLLREAGTLTKASLVARIEEMKAKRAASNSISEGLPIRESAADTALAEPENRLENKAVEDRVWAQLKLIRRKRKLLENKKIQTRFARIEKELKDIIEIAAQEGVEL